MDDLPRGESPPGARRVYRRVDPDMTDEALDAWAHQFINAVLGDGVKEDDDA